MGSTNKIAVNKRLFYFLLFLIIVIPVVVGTLVWHFTKQTLNKRDTDSATLANKYLGKGKTSLSPATSTQPANKYLGSGKTSLSPAAKSTQPTTSGMDPWENLRLPTDVMPVHYDITLYPNFYDDNGWFYGNETIEIEIRNSTQYILVHFNYLNITKTTLTEKQSKRIIDINETFPYAKNQFYVIKTSVPLQAGSRVLLELQFDGSLTRAIVGFYKSTYVNSITKERRYLAASKFEPVSARRTFPCFDEPNIKANYTIHLVHREEYIALSNMPEMRTSKWEHDNRLEITDFKRSVKMSTYLVCFIVCDFEYLNATTKFGTQVRTFATPDRVNQTAYALQVAVKSMELYEELFNVKYPLPKQDMIAIPDFVSGAMEHWGLITYRETAMLFDPLEASSVNQQRVATVVAHEISHQWFGNIVTMDWWDDLWLNEGFASFMEYLGANKSEPEWEMISQFVTQDVQPVMITDAGVSSHPIVVDVQNPNQINEVFDSISYSKGSAVIRMLEAIMGRDKFFKGVEAYLKKFKWGNAKTSDLWESLGEIDQNLSVRNVMDTWTRQMGFPIINITFDETMNKAKATQTRFLAERTTTYNESESQYRYKWYVYLDYTTNNASLGHVWMKKADVTFDIPVNPITNVNAWIKFNTEQTGFYRVNYPDSVWRKFAMELNNDSTIMTDTDKSGLLDDAFNLARGGYLQYDVALDMIQYLDKEDSYLPWKSAIKGMGYIEKMFRFGGEFGNWRKFILAKVKPRLTKIGWNSTGSHLEKLLRIDVISLACSHGDTECLNNATQRFRHWIHHEESLPPNTRSLVYRFGMQSSTQSSDWDVMLQRYMTETVPQERIKLLFGLSQTPTIWLLQRYLEYTRNESIIRSQDFFTVLEYIGRNPVGRGLVWDWIRSNWDYLIARFTTFSRYLGKLIPRVISDFNTEFQLSEVEDFFKKYPDAGAGARGRKQAVESIKRNIQWMKKYRLTISNWLCKHVPNC